MIPDPAPPREEAAVGCDLREILGHLCNMQEDYPSTTRAIAACVERIKTQLAARDAALRVCQESERSARACLDSLVTDIKAAMGQRYREIVDEAEGDISVNTAFKVALRDEREVASEQEAALTICREQLVEQRVLGHGEGQEHTIADVNAGRVDDLIAPRLEQEREAALAQTREALQALVEQWRQHPEALLDHAAEALAAVIASLPPAP